MVGVLSTTPAHEIGLNSFGQLGRDGDPHRRLLHLVEEVGLADEVPRPRRDGLTSPFPVIRLGPGRPVLPKP